MAGLRGTRDPRIAFVKTCCVAVRAGAIPCLLLFQGCTSGVAASPSPKESLPIRVSMIRLLASPEHFEGRRVQVQGYCRLESEDRALYLNRDDAEYVSIANSLWLDTGQGRYDLDEGFVIVEGTFTVKEHGHLGLWPGEIRGITRLERAISHTEYRKLIEKEKTNRHR
jgi:hypothetical protein